MIVDLITLPLTKRSKKNNNTQLTLKKDKVSNSVDHIERYRIKRTA